MAVEIDEMIVEIKLVGGESQHYEDNIPVVGVKIHHRNLLLIDQAGQNLYLIVVIDNNIIGQSQTQSSNKHHHHYHNQRTLDPIHRRIHLRLPLLHIAVVLIFP